MTADVQLLCLGAALAIDAVVGDPPALWTRVPHPVVLIGKAIDLLDRRLNRAGDSCLVRRMSGAIALAILLLAAGLTGAVIERLAGHVPLGSLVEGVVVVVFLAQKSLADHVSAVGHALAEGGLPDGRLAVARIVGRNPETLDESGVVRAAIESLAENFSDAVVAPAFWYAVAGLPGLLVYKALNTADSMIGHRTPRHECFGWAAARLDDMANIPPARISALLLAAGALLNGAAGAAGQALRTAWREARNHRSPNAGWPEAAMAGLLGIALSGPRSYARGATVEPWINGEARRILGTGDISSAVSHYWRASTMQVCIILALAYVWPRLSFY